MKLAVGGEVGEKNVLFASALITRHRHAYR
jgi:hypothetical protein